jgi:hypothetical protein
VTGHFEVSFLRGAVAEGQGIVAVVVFGQLQMHQAHARRPESGAVPKSGLEPLTSNRPTSWGQFKAGFVVSMVHLTKL